MIPRNSYVSINSLIFIHFNFNFNICMDRSISVYAMILNFFLFLLSFSHHVTSHISYIMYRFINKLPEACVVGFDLCLTLPIWKKKKYCFFFLWWWFVLFSGECVSLNPMRRKDTVEDSTDFIFHYPFYINELVNIGFFIDYKWNYTFIRSWLRRIMYNDFFLLCLHAILIALFVNNTWVWFLKLILNWCVYQIYQKALW